MTDTEVFNLFYFINNVGKNKSKALEACSEGDIDKTLSYFTELSVLDIREVLMCAGNNDDVNMFNAVLHSFPVEIVDEVVNYDTLITLHHAMALNNLYKMAEYFMSDYNILKNFINYAQVLILSDVYESTEVVDELLKHKEVIKDIIAEDDNIIDDLQPELLNKILNLFSLNTVDELKTFATII